MKRKFLITLLLLIAFAFGSQSFAQGTGSISGVIKDDQGVFLPGATVYIQDLQTGTVTDRYGKFELTRVPAGDHQLTISFIGFSTQTKDVTVSEGNVAVVNVTLSSKYIKLQDITVTSIRKGQVKALNLQKNAGNITDVVSQEEITKYPDLTAADAMKRLPGVTVQTSYGEGKYVSIRGTSPGLTSVTVNGQKISSPTDGKRYVGLDVVNASQLELIEVSKTLTPDMEADAIGGTINLITKTAFDHTKTYFNVKTSSGLSTFSGKPLFTSQATFSTLLGAKKNFGFTVGGSWNRNNIGGQQDEFDYDESDLPDGTIMPNALQDFYLMNSSIVRDRQGANVEFDYRIKNKHRFFINGMYNRRNDYMFRSTVRYRPGKGDYLTENTISRARMAYELSTRNEIQSISQFSAGGHSDFGNLIADYSVSYGFADEVKPKAYKSEWQLDTKPDMSIDNSNVDFPIFTLTNIASDYSYDPAHWEIDKQDWRKTKTTNSNFAAHLDFKTNYRLGSWDGNLKFGAKHRSENKDRNNNRISYKWKGTNDVFMDQVASDKQVTDFLGGRYVVAPFIDYAKYDAFFEANKDNDNALRPNIKYDDTDGIGGKYNASESVTGAYAMTTISKGKFKAIIGLRDEYTATNYQGVLLLYDPSSEDLTGNKDTTVNKSYNKIFPNLHLEYKINNKTNIRFAVTRGISRPDYFNLAPYFWLNGNVITTGNPDLRPTKAWNFDLMYGHYFQGIGVINAGLFEKQLTDIIYTNAYLIHGGIYDGYVENTTANGDNASLYGFELNWMQQFTFLPGFLSGFGIYANYTFTQSTTNLQRMDEDQNIRHITSVPGQLGNVGNLGLNYEKYNFNARLSLYYAQHYLYDVRESPAYDRYKDNYTQLDFTCSYSFKKYIELFANVFNITNAPTREYFETTTRPRVNQFVGTSYQLGLRFTL